MEEIKISNISKYFEKEILSDISLEIEKNKITGILGPSGSGKTTLLRIISGLEIPDKGTIFINNKCVCSEKIFVEPEKRNIGFVFQDLGLWPHMNAEEHLDFVLDAKGITNSEQKEKEITKILKLVNLDKYIKSYPRQLSGGEKQRLAIARVLAQDSKILLLDEPFSNLDPVLKKELKKELVGLQKKMKLTIVYITHNPSEIFDIADKIVILKEGRILQEGKPKEFLKKPKNDFVRKFLS
ncbi:MAG: ABC transporter ATP-binding protein [Candidatus Aenigmarchaeota archaeon]|nr:ABC transporter ATP-binding protein [Candidatus Aenigmarchaeota archaeon]